MNGFEFPSIQSRPIEVFDHAIHFNGDLLVTLKCLTIREQNQEWMNLLRSLADDAGDMLTAWVLLVNWAATIPGTQQLESRHARKFLKLRLDSVNKNVREKAHKRLASASFEIAMIQRLTVCQAIERARREQPQFDLNPKATLYTAVHTTLGAEFWIFHFSCELISSDLHVSLNFLMYDYRTDNLFHLIIPTQHLRDISSSLSGPMSKKGRLHLKLSASEDDLLRSKPGGEDFSQFLQGRPLEEKQQLWRCNAAP